MDIHAEQKLFREACEEQGMPYSDASFSGYLICRTAFEKEIIEAKRYRWLRNNQRKARSKQRPSDAPYVINPIKSVLYAISDYRGDDLDKAIDADILNDMAQHIFEEVLINGDNRLSNPNFRFSDELADECEYQARSILGMNVELIKEPS